MIFLCYSFYYVDFDLSHKRISKIGDGQAILNNY